MAERNDLFNLGSYSSNGEVKVLLCLLELGLSCTTMVVRMGGWGVVERVEKPTNVF